MGISASAPYRQFGQKVKATKRKILQFLIEAKETGKTLAGYGAPGKGTRS